MHNIVDQIILKLSRGLVQKDVPALAKVLLDSLKDMGGYFKAGRILLFQYDTIGKTFSVIYEWHNENLFPLAKGLQHLHAKDHMILGKFKDPNLLVQITNTANIPDSYPFDKQFFARTDCKSFMQKALMSEDRVMGFMVVMNNASGVNGPELPSEYIDQTAQLLSVMLTKIAFLSKNLPQANKISGSEEAKLIRETQNRLTEYFSRLFDNVLYGIAVFDTKPQRFIFSNKKFNELFGLNKGEIDDIANVFQIFGNNGYTPGDFFSYDQLAKVKDFSLECSGRFISGNISPVKETSWEIISANDITPITTYEKAEKVVKSQMKIINEAGINFITPDQDEKTLLKYIGETAKMLLPDSVVIVNKYNIDDGNLRSIYVDGFAFSADSVAKLLGRDPLNKTYPLDPKSEAYKELLSSHITEVKGGITELSYGAIAAPVARRIEKLSRVNRFFSCGLSSDGLLYGSMNILARPGAEINFYVLKTFARMASNALHAANMRQKLARTSKALADATSIAKIGYWEYDFETQTFLISKVAFQRLDPNPKWINAGEEIAIPLDKLLTSFIFEEDVRKIKKAFEKVSENRDADNYFVDLEFRAVNSSGNILYIYTRAVTGRNKKMMGIAQDVSKIRSVEKSLWESELKFQNLVEQSLDAIAVVKDDGVITEWNPRAEEITGLKCDDVLGKYAWEIESAMLFNPSIERQHPQQSPGKLRQRFVNFFHSSLARKPFSSEITIKTKEEEVRYLAVTSFVFNANRSKYLCRISKDITLEKEKQEREKQIEIMQKTAKAKDLFMDNMSHEMRTPLGGIIGMTDILLNTRMSAQQNEMLKIVKESSDSLLELITNIHELSRLEAHGVVIQQKPFRLQVMLEKIVSIFKASAIQKSIELVLTNRSPSDIRIVGDEFRLRQIIGNLVGNALKFTPPGGRVDVVVEAKPVDDKTMEVIFEIKDTGIGIENNKIPYLFDKFVQADSSYTREYEGVGIGLSICRELIRLMGGDIGVESQHRKGSVFWVKVTLAFLED
jgi:signal transduction histidine kinase